MKGTEASKVAKTIDANKHETKKVPQKRTENTVTIPIDNKNDCKDKNISKTISSEKDTNVLSSLLGGYASSSDENDEEDENNDKCQKTLKSSVSKDPILSNYSTLNQRPPNPTEFKNNSETNLSSSSIMTTSVTNQPSNSNANSNIDTANTMCIIATSSTQESTQAQRNHSNNKNHNSTKNIKSTPTTKLCHNFLRRGRCKRGPNCSYVHDEEARKQYLEKQRENSRRRQGNHNTFTASNKSLLKILLQREMRREACLTLQCLRFMVQNNYFLDLTTTVTSNSSSACGVHKDRDHRSKIPDTNN